MNARQPASDSNLAADRTTILDRIDMPREDQIVAVLEKSGRITTGRYAGTIPGRHDASDWFRRMDRWIVVEDNDNVAHIPTEWIRQAVVQHDA